MAVNFALEHNMKGTLNIIKQGLPTATARATLTYRKLLNNKTSKLQKHTPVYKLVLNHTLVFTLLPYLDAVPTSGSI